MLRAAHARWRAAQTTIRSKVEQRRFLHLPRFLSSNGRIVFSKMLIAKHCKLFFGTVERGAVDKGIDSWSARLARGHSRRHGGRCRDQALMPSPPPATATALDSDRLEAAGGRVASGREPPRRYAGANVRFDSSIAQSRRSAFGQFAPMHEPASRDCQSGQGSAFSMES
jgi:hypothetical protein